MQTRQQPYSLREKTKMIQTAEMLRAAREEILHDWMQRVRSNQMVRSQRNLSDPVLLDHVPQLFDAILDLVAEARPRKDTEQYAVVHGFARRLTGYDVQETVIELLMLRRAIWAHLTETEAPAEGAYAAMERIDGMVDRAVTSSLQAFLDPDARMLERRTPGGETQE
jgi:hypothetical protein